MKRRNHILAIAVAAGALAFLAASQVAQAEGPIFARPQYDVGYSYYVNPPPSGGVGASLYPAPIHTPAYVGHTYYTYQPFMPHEFMYHHAEVYRRYNHRFSPIPLNTTRVIYW